MRKCVSVSQMIERLSGDIQKARKKIKEKNKRVNKREQRLAKVSGVFKMPVNRVPFNIVLVKEPTIVDDAIVLTVRRPKQTVHDLVVSDTCLLAFTVKLVLSSHSRVAQKVAALGRWLLSGGEYQYKIKVWEHSVWLLKTGWLLKKSDR